MPVNKDDNLSTLQTDVAVMKNDIKYIKETINKFAFTPQSQTDELRADLRDFKAEVAKGYVPNEAFKPIKALFWGIISAVVTAIVLAGLAFLIRKP